MSTAPAGAAIGLWSRTELARRWRALVLLGVLAGLAGGLVIAALEGADRTSSSYRRMREELRGADAVFFPSQSGVFDVDLTLLDQIPEVESWGGFALMPSQFLELPPGSSPFVFVGPDWFGDIERAKVIEGRLPDPDADDELVLNEAAAAQGGELGFDEVIGTELTLATLTLDEFIANGEQEPADWTTAEGPRFTMRIVGVVRQPMVGAVSFASDPFAATGPGWAAAHLNELTPYFQNAVVRLRNGAADVPAFREGIARVYGQDLTIKDLHDDIKRVENSTGLERTGLLLFAAAVLIASIVLVGQAFLRSAHAGADSVPPLRSMGMGPRNLVRGIALPHLLTVAVAIVVAAITAVLVSTRFPIGLARRLDPDVGMRLRPGYVFGGALLVGVAAVVATMVSSVLATRASLRHAGGGRVRMVGAASRRSTGTRRRRRQPGPGAAGSRRLGPGPSGAPGHHRRGVGRGGRGHVGGRHRRRPRQPGPVGGQLGRRHRWRRRGDRRRPCRTTRGWRISPSPAGSPVRSAGRTRPSTPSSRSRGPWTSACSRDERPRARTRRCWAPGRPRCSGWASATRSPSVRPTCRPASSASAS